MMPGTSDRVLVMSGTLDRVLALPVMSDRDLALGRYIALRVPCQSPRCEKMPNMIGRSLQDEHSTFGVVTVATHTTHTTQSRFFADVPNMLRVHATLLA